MISSKYNGIKTTFNDKISTGDDSSAIKRIKLSINKVKLDIETMDVQIS